MVMRNVYIKEEEEDQFHFKLTKHDVLIPLLATFKSFRFLVAKSTDYTDSEAGEHLGKYLGAFFAKGDKQQANDYADRLISLVFKEKDDELKSKIVEMLTTWDPFDGYVRRELRNIFGNCSTNAVEEIVEACKSLRIPKWREDLKERAISIAKTAWVPSIAPDAQVQYCKGTYLCAKPFKRPGDAKFREEAPPYEVLIDPRQEEAQLDDLRKFYEWIETAPKEGKFVLQLEEKYMPLYLKLFRRWCLPIASPKSSRPKAYAYQRSLADYTRIPREVKVERIQEALKAYQKFCDPIDFKQDDPESIYVKMHFEGVVRYVAIKPDLYQFLDRNLERLKEIMNDFKSYLKSVRQYLGAPNATEEGLNHLKKTCEEINTRFAAFATQDEVQGLPWTTFWSEALMRPLRLCEKRHAEQAQASLF